MAARYPWEEGYSGNIIDENGNNVSATPSWNTPEGPMLMSGPKTVTSKNIPLEQ